MSITHRTLAGDWAVCPAPETCELLFHFPQTTPLQMAAVPLELLLPVLNAVDPPRQDTVHGAAWFADGYMHRDYDLPAQIKPEYMLWYRHGKLHREHDRPARVLPDGELEWFVDGYNHRADDQPALIRPSGVRAWYRDGVLHRADGLPAVINPTIYGVNLRNLDEAGDRFSLTRVQPQTAEYWTAGRLTSTETL